MSLYCVDVVLRCLHREDDNTFYRGFFKQAISEMTREQFDRFCTQVRQLEEYHACTVGRWHTDRPDCFANIEKDFYRMPFPVSEGSGGTGHHWAIIDIADEGNGHFSRQLFLQELSGTSDEGLYRFFNNLLQLEHHRAYAENCWYVDYPWLAQNITDVPTEELLFEFDEIDRDEPLYFRIEKP